MMVSGYMLRGSALSINYILLLLERRILPASVPVVLY